MCPPFITLGRTEYRSLLPTVHIIPCLSVVAEMHVNSVVMLQFVQAYPLPQKRMLASHCLAMDYSSFHASCHNIIVGNFSAQVRYNRTGNEEREQEIKT
jgi:hypothetical protein